MDKDELMGTHEAAHKGWTSRLKQQTTFVGITDPASRYRNGQVCAYAGVTMVSFNARFKVVFDDGIAWAVRFPVAGRAMYPDEKVLREDAVMRFIKEKTQIPVPRLIAFGMAADNFDPGIGPFTITEWIDGVTLSSVIEVLPRPTGGPQLRDDISDDVLYDIYRQMAGIMLELSMHDFDQIGALSTIENDGKSTSWTVSSRPMSLKMNETERAGYVTMNVSEYMEYQLSQNTRYLAEQRNSVSDDDDARRKIILRRQLKALIPSFVVKEHNHGPLKLYCDEDSVSVSSTELGWQ